MIGIKLRLMIDDVADSYARKDPELSLTDVRKKYLAYSTLTFYKPKKHILIEVSDPDLKYPLALPVLSNEFCVFRQVIPTANPYRVELRNKEGLLVVAAVIDDHLLGELLKTWDWRKT